MKSLDELLSHLTDAQVAEFAVATGRLPCIKVDGTFKPIDKVAPTTEDMLGMLGAAGGQSEIANLGGEPVTWTTKWPGIGLLSVVAVRRDQNVQARFIVVRRDAIEAVPGAHCPPPPPATRPQDNSPPAAEKVAQILEQKSPSSVGSLFELARGKGASDLHIIADRPPLLRIAGELVPAGSPLDPALVEKLVRPLVPERNAQSIEEQGSCDFALEYPPFGRFRVNVSRQRTGLKGCFRLIASEVPTLASLGLPEAISSALDHHQGLIVITGPTGHGKTSTLAALVDLINTRTSHHVITIEDPVEFLHPRKMALMSQREVGAHTQSFATALKATLREDPDVIVVGELRDTETVRMAMMASETGHLVLGTMNTPSAAKAIDRLIDLFPPADQGQIRMTLAGGLRLIVGQKLLPDVTGTRMVAAAELLPGSIPLWSLIRDGRTFQIPSLQQRGKGLGILRLDESLLDLLKAGRISIAAARLVAEAPDELELVFSGGKARTAEGPAPAAARDSNPRGVLSRAGDLLRKKDS